MGNLIYITITRPYLNYAIRMVSQFMQTPWNPHLNAMRCILRYIKHILQCEIFNETKSQLQVHKYTYANWDGNISNMNRLMVSYFFWEVVLLVGAVKTTNSCTIKHEGKI
jgi:hypothetical protein